jgi:hypothetical protein
LIANCICIRPGLLRNLGLNTGQKIWLLLQNADYLLSRHRLLRGHLARLLIRHPIRLHIRHLVPLRIRHLVCLLIRRLAGLLIGRLTPHMIRNLGYTTPGGTEAAKQYGHSESKQETADAAPSRPGIRTTMVAK